MSVQPTRSRTRVLKMIVRRARAVQSRARGGWLLIAPALSFVLGIVIVVFNRRLLPSRFFYDADQIQRLASETHRAVDFSDPSFGAVAAVYRILGLADSALLAGLVTYLAASFLVVIAFRLHAGRILVAGAVAGSLAFLVSAVYLGTYSKDLIVLPLAFLVLKARNDWKGEAAVLIGIVLYAHAFREYWYLNAAIYAIFVLISKFRPPRPVTLALPVVALIALAIVSFSILGIDSDFARTQVNTLRQGTEDARTAIGPFVDWPGALGPMVNTLLTLATLIFPVPLLITAQPYYLAAALVIIGIWASFAMGAWAARSGTVAFRCLLFVLTFLTTQALFEPDYGSALRHTTPLLALVTYCALESARRRGGRRSLTRLSGSRRRLATPKGSEGSSDG